MTANLGIVDTKKMIAAINENYGLDLIDFSLTTLKNRFLKALTHFNISQIDEFVEQIKRNNLNFHELLDLLMIDTTELFRDPSLWRELKENYLPEIGRSPGSKIWMPGEASGDELFSLMVLLHELNYKNDPRVVVSCPSQIRTEKIKAGGLYDLKKFELGEANYTRLSGKFEFTEFYKLKNNRIEMNTSLLAGVEFNNFNIVQEKPNKTYRMIIFRNVLIQYNLPLYEKVVRKLIDSLTIGGYLILGNMETLEHSEVGKKMQLVNEAEKIYKKRID